MLEASLANAEPGSRWQLERVGYFIFDSEDSRPGAPVLNRIVTLRDSWQGGHKEASPVAPAAAAEATETATRAARSTTRPPRKSRLEYRAEARVRDPLLGERLSRWPGDYGISGDDAELLSGDRATGDLFVDTVAAGAPPKAVARWIINELPHELDDRDLAEVPMTAGAFGRLILAAESGAVSAAAAKEVFAELLRQGGEPDEIIRARGLAQVSDEATISAIVDQVLGAHPDKVAQYRGGRTALLGFFVGQVIRASNGKANPQVINKVLTERLG
jgi:glutaminyl-tRNA synthetase